MCSVISLDLKLVVRTKRQILIDDSGCPKLYWVVSPTAAPEEMRYRYVMEEQINMASDLQLVIY